LKKQRTVQDIAARMKEGKVSPEEIEELKSDPRKGVRRLLESYRRKQVLEEQENSRLRRLFRLEKALQKAGYYNVAGVDEAGRGPLAGPVVAAAVVLPSESYLQGLNDSKQLSFRRREEIFEEIKVKARAVDWATADVQEIDYINIHRASLMAMKRAVQKLEERVDFVLVDGFSMEGINLPQRPVKKGDSRCASIAAASVVAKVVRDRMMQELDELYPGYGFAQHKGYGTADHREAILRLGPAPPHRKSFLKNVCGTEVSR